MRGRAKGQQYQPTVATHVGDGDGATLYMVKSCWLLRHTQPSGLTRCMPQGVARSLAEVAGSTGWGLSSRRCSSFLARRRWGHG